MYYTCSSATSVILSSSPAIISTLVLPHSQSVMKIFDRELGPALQTAARRDLFNLQLCSLEHGGAGAQIKGETKRVADYASETTPDLQLYPTYPNLAGYLADRVNDARRDSEFVHLATSR